MRHFVLRQYLLHWRLYQYIICKGKEVMNKKRITSFVMAFICVFSIVIGLLPTKIAKAQTTFEPPYTCPFYMIDMATFQQTLSGNAVISNNDSAINITNTSITQDVDLEVFQEHCPIMMLDASEQGIESILADYPDDCIPFYLTASLGGDHFINHFSYSDNDEWVNNSVDNRPDVSFDITVPIPDGYFVNTGDAVINISGITQGEIDASDITYADENYHLDYTVNNNNTITITYKPYYAHNRWTFGNCTSLVPLKQEPTNIVLNATPIEEGECIATPHSSVPITIETGNENVVVSNTILVPENYDINDFYGLSSGTQFPNGTFPLTLEKEHTYYMMATINTNPQEITFSDNVNYYATGIDFVEEVPVSQIKALMIDMGESEESAEQFCKQTRFVILKFEPITVITCPPIFVKVTLDLPSVGELPPKELYDFNNVENAPKDVGLKFNVISPSKNTQFIKYIEENSADELDYYMQSDSLSDIVKKKIEDTLNNSIRYSVILEKDRSDILLDRNIKKGIEYVFNSELDSKEEYIVIGNQQAYKISDLLYNLVPVSITNNNIDYISDNIVNYWQYPDGIKFIINDTGFIVFGEGDVAGKDYFFYHSGGNSYLNGSFRIPCEVTYNLDGGVFNDANSVINNYYTNDEDIILPQPTKEGYEFLGWTGEGITEPTLNVIIPTGSTGDRVYTANWKASANPDTNNTDNPDDADNTDTPIIPYIPVKPIHDTEPIDDITKNKIDKVSPIIDRLDNDFLASAEDNANYTISGVDTSDYEPTVNGKYIEIYSNHVLLAPIDKMDSINNIDKYLVLTLNANEGWEFSDELLVELSDEYKLINAVIDSEDTTLIVEYLGEQADVNEDVPSTPDTPVTPDTPDTPNTSDTPNDIPLGLVGDITDKTPTITPVIRQTENTKASVVNELPLRSLGDKTSTDNTTTKIVDTPKTSDDINMLWILLFVFVGTFGGSLIILCKRY